MDVDAIFAQIGTQVAAILVILIVNQAHYIMASYTSKFERSAPTERHLQVLHCQICKY